MSVASVLEGKAAAALNIINAGNISGAERLLKEVLAADPEHARANTLMSVVLLRLGKPQAAIEQADVAIGLSPTADAFCFKSMALTRLGRHTCAIDAAEAAVSAAPRYGDAAFILGQALEASGRPIEAEAEFRRAVELAPGADLFRSALGRFLMHRNDLSGAERIAAELDPSSETEAALLLRGEIAFRRNRFKEARDFALWALSQNAKSRDALRLLAQVKTQQNLLLRLLSRASLMAAGGYSRYLFAIPLGFLFAALRLSKLWSWSTNIFCSLSVAIIVMLILYESGRKLFIELIVARELAVVKLRK